MPSAGTDFSNPGCFGAVWGYTAEASALTTVPLHPHTAAVPTLRPVVNPKTGVVVPDATTASTPPAVAWDVSYYAGTLKQAAAGSYYPATGAAADPARASHAQPRFACRTTGGTECAYYGKQRGVFGPYLVVSKDEYTMEFWGYSGASATAQAWALLFTTTKVAELQLLGSHEYYYWPGRSMLLARLADGASFRFWRFASDFATSAAANDAVVGEKKIT